MNIVRGIIAALVWAVAVGKALGGGARLWPGGVLYSRLPGKGWG